MSIFINGIASISPQDNFTGNILNGEIKEYNSTHLTCIEPEYKDFIPAKQLRRMSRIIKMGIVASIIALKDARISEVDTIIAGTGLGCIEDTEKFLSSIIDNEKFTNPAAFIQSTHNTIASQIAFFLKSNSFNSTHVHRSLSLENALLNSILLINDKFAQDILVGGIDELTEKSISILKRLGLSRRKNSSNLNLKNNNFHAPMIGEGAAFFVLSNNKNENTYTEIGVVDTAYKLNSLDEIVDKIKNLSLKGNIEPDQIDLFLTGYSGDKRNDSLYNELGQRFKGSRFGFYKHLCGEYNTSTAFALWLSSLIIKKGVFPKELHLSGSDKKKEIQNILIYNHYHYNEHSFILLKKC